MRALATVAGMEQEGVAVHVVRERKWAKLWLDPAVNVADVGRYSDHEINEIIEITERERRGLLGAWRRFFRETSDQGRPPEVRPL